MRERILAGEQDERASEDETAALRPLRVLTVAVIALPLALFCVSGALSYFAAMDDARDQMVRVAQVVHEHGEKVFESQSLVLDQAEAIIGGLSDGQIRDRQAEIDQRLARLRKGLDQIDDIRIIGADGILLAASRQQPLGFPDYRDRDFFKILRDAPVGSNETYVSSVRSSRVRQESIFFVGRRRAAGDAGGFSGVVAVTMTPAYFNKFYEEVSRTVPSAIALFKDNGDRLARYPAGKEGEPRVLTYASFLRAVKVDPRKGVYEAGDSVDGRDRIIAYEKLDDVPVYVGVGIERATVVWQWALSMARHLVFGIPAIILLLVLTRSVQRRVRGEQRALARLRAEIGLREETEAQLRQSQKMDAIGRLTGGIAHDFNNLLTIVSGSLDLMERRVGETDPRLTRLVGNARQGASRAALLTRQLLAFARRQPLDPRPTDINRLVRELSSLLSRTLGEPIAIETVLGGGAWHAIVDPPQLENALVNLAVNARDAMPEGGRLTIETANAHFDEAYARANQGVAPGQYVSISVTDTGAGIEPDILDKVVEPFFTTKATGQGTGLGLSQVFGFIRQSGGNVKIYSEIAVGTTVRLYLPRYVGPMPAQEEVALLAIDAEAARGVTILVAEDDDDVRMLTAESLAEFGYRVVTAGNGIEALERLSQEPDVRLLLTDVVMPMMDGRKLADAAQKLRPEMPVVFMTGYTPNAIVHNGTLDPGVHLLTKPFTLRQLSEKMRTALETAAKP